jgi:hypothetical protein
MSIAPQLRRTAAALALAVPVLVVLGGCGGGVDRDDPVKPNAGALEVVSSSGKSTSEPTGHEPFAAAGGVTSLAPGDLATLRVTVTNPDQVAYQILELTASPQDANAACAGAANLLVGRYDSSKPGAPAYVVPRGSSITIPLTVMMLDTARSQDACRNVTFPIVYTGRATQGVATQGGATQGVATQGVATQGRAGSGS